MRLAAPLAVPPPRPAAAVRPSAPRPPVLRKTTWTDAVALTFDDGPDPRWTPQVLAMLRQHKVKATFCLVGNQVRRYPGLVRQIVKEGHTVCNHTMSHDEHLRQKSSQRIAADLAQTSALIRKAGGVTPRFFRAPGGNWSSRVIAVAASQHMQALHWTVDPQDWRRPPAARIIATVKNSTRPGSIILEHDAGGNRSHTMTAMRALLPYLAARYRLIAL
jgi:peptidoglycan/xylan/chitin deacetylase (PgdA/CDA1 family)